MDIVQFLVLHHQFLHSVAYYYMQLEVNPMTNIYCLFGKLSMPLRLQLERLISMLLHGIPAHRNLSLCLSCHVPVILRYVGEQSP